MSLMAQLKSETAEVHARTESHLRFLAADFTLAEYRETLLRFLGFYRPCEAALTHATAGSSLEHFVRERLKTPAISHDLALLGCTDAEVAATPDTGNLPRLDTPASALGMMYVLEGATLGGAIVARHLRQHFGWSVVEGTNQAGAQVEQTRPLQFFTVYGDQLRDRWRAFAELTEQHASPENSPRICAVACQTFSRFEGWLQPVSKLAG
jgi:heme oxygenase